MASGELGQDNIRRALKGFAEVLDLEIDGYSAAIRDAIENGRIQKFEYYSELFWKYVRSCLQSEGKEVPNSPRGTAQRVAGPRLSTRGRIRGRHADLRRP